MYKPFFYSTYFTVQFSNSGFIFSRESGYISAHSSFGSPCNSFLESRDGKTRVKGAHTLQILTDYSTLYQAEGGD